MALEKVRFTSSFTARILGICSCFCPCGWSPGCCSCRLVVLSSGSCHVLSFLEHLGQRFLQLLIGIVEDCGPIADPQLEHLSSLDRVDSVRIGTGGPLDPQRLGLALSLLAALCTVRRRNLQTAVLSALCVESHASKRVLSTRAGGRGATTRSAEGEAASRNWSRGGAY